MVFDMSKIVSLRAFRFSHLFFTILSRFFCLAIEDFFAIIPLFFTGRPFLALLAVGVFFVDDIDSASAADNLVPFQGIRFDGSSTFHTIAFV